MAQSRDLPPPRQEVRALRWLASQIASGRAGPCCLANSGRRLASEHRHYKQPSRFAVKPELGFALKTLGLCNASGRSNRYACGPASCRRWAAAYRCIGNDLLADAVWGWGRLDPGSGTRLRAVGREGLCASRFFFLPTHRATFMVKLWFFATRKRDVTDRRGAWGRGPFTMLRFGNCNVPDQPAERRVPAHV